MADGAQISEMGASSTLLGRRSSLQQFVVTILLGSQSFLLIVAPALLKQTEPLGLIIGVCAVATAVAFYVELLLRPLRPSSRPSRYVSLGSARAVFAIGVVATVAAALSGRSSYAVQVGLAEESPLGRFFTPFSVWLLFGVGLHFWLLKRERVSRRQAVAVAAVACAVQLWVGLQLAILGASAAFIVTVMVMALLGGVIRLRVLVVTLLVIPLLWPPLYGLRDELRRQISGATAAVSADDALGRLQLDEQMAVMERLVPLPVGLEPPPLGLLIRTGLIPGFLDRDRPPLDTGTRMSVALGGSPTNSQSATVLGNVFIFGGWFGVIFFSSSVAIVMALLLRRANPWAVIAAGLVYWYALSFNASYPDVIPKVLQAAESMLICYLFVNALSARASRELDPTRKRPTVTLLAEVE